MSVSPTSSVPNISISLITALCFLVAVLEGYDLQVVAVAGPALRAAMKLSPEQVGMTFGASLIGLAIGAIIGGSIADHVGRKAVLIGSVAILGIFTFLTIFSASFHSFLFVRVLAGVGLGGAMPTVIALLADATGNHRTTSVVTTAICGQPLGGILVGIIGRAMEHYSWQSLFVVGGLLTLALVPLLMRKLVDSHSTNQTENVVKGRMKVSQTLFGEGRASGTILLCALFIVTLALLSIILSWTPLLVIAKGLPKMVGFSAIVALNIGGIIGGITISLIIDKVGVKIPMLLTYVGMAITLYVFAHAHSSQALLLTAVVMGFCVLGAQFTLYGVAPRLFPVDGRSSGVGVAVAMGRIGSVMGPVLFGMLIGAGASEDRAVLVMAPAALFAALIVVGLVMTTGKKLAA